MRAKTRRQRAIEAGRIRAGAGFSPELIRAVKAEARRWDVSIPFVLSVISADILGIELPDEDRYRPRVTKLRRVS